MDENIMWHQNKVTSEERQKVLKQKGLVIWFTGLSGSGKSTIAVELEKMLIDSGYVAYLLDGDNVRHGINSDLGFTNEDRNENIRRISEIAALFQDAGLITLVSAISPFLKMREFARERAGDENFIEIWVNTSFEVCQKRDPKGLYRKQIQNFTGRDSVYEEPQHPDIILDTIDTTPKECAGIVYQKIIDRIKSICCYSASQER